MKNLRFYKVFGALGLENLRFIKVFGVLGLENLWFIKVFMRYKLGKWKFSQVLS